MSRAGVLTWAAIAKNTDPTFFAGGTLSTGFTGTYGTSMVPTPTISPSHQETLLTTAQPLGVHTTVVSTGRGNSCYQTRGGTYGLGAHENATALSSPTGLMNNQSAYFQEL